MSYFGSWDIGSYELTLDRPLVEHVIGRTGLIGAYRWIPTIRITVESPFGSDFHCGKDEGLINKRKGKELAAGYPKVKDALLWFQSPTPLPFKKAKISSRAEIVSGFKDKSDKEGTIEMVVVYEIDLNHDGIPEFVQWDRWGKSELWGTYPVIVLREVFANINGEWHPFEMDFYAECT